MSGYLILVQMKIQEVSDLDRLNSFVVRHRCNDDDDKYNVYESPENQKNQHSIPSENDMN